MKMVYLNSHMHSHRLYKYNARGHAVHPHGIPTCTSTVHFLEYIRTYFGMMVHRFH